MLISELEQKCYFFAPVYSALKRKAVELRAVHLDEDGVIRVAFTNPTDEIVALSRGSRIAHVRMADATNSIFSIETRQLPSNQDIDELYNKLRLGSRGLTPEQDKKVRTMLHDCFGAFS